MYSKTSQNDPANQICVFLAFVESVLRHYQNHIRNSPPCYRFYECGIDQELRGNCASLLRINVSICRKFAFICILHCVAKISRVSLKDDTKLGGLT